MAAVDAAAPRPYARLLERKDGNAVDGTQVDDLIKRLATRPLTRSKVLRGLTASAAALAGLPMVFVSPASAKEREEEVLQRAFDELLAGIATYVPERLQSAFLAKVDSANALLLPAVQSAREAPRKACAAVRILKALRHQNQVAADTAPHDYVVGYEIVEDDINAVLRLISLPPRC